MKYETRFIVKAYNYFFDRKGNKRLKTSTKFVIKDEEEAHKKAWELEKNYYFVTIEKEECRSKTQLILKRESL